MQEYMRKRFILSLDYLSGLRCLEYDGMAGEKPVKRFKIFDPGEVRKKVGRVKTIQDLDQHPEVLMFEGYIDQSGAAYAADRRMPKNNNNKR